MLKTDADGKIRLQFATGAVVLPRREVRARIDPDGTVVYYTHEVSPMRVLSEEDWRTVCRAREIMGADL